MTADTVYTRCGPAWRVQAGLLVHLVCHIRGESAQGEDAGATWKRISEGGATHRCRHPFSLTSEASRRRVRPYSTCERQGETVANSCAGSRSFFGLLTSLGLRAGCGGDPVGPASARPVR